MCKQEFDDRTIALFKIDMFIVFLAYNKIFNYK